MLASLALAAVALRLGLRLRAARRAGRGGRRRAHDRRLHLRIAKPAVALVAVGFVAGPISAVWLRGMEPFGTAHALVATTALALFVATFLVGRQLERGRSRARDAHALLGLLALLAGAAALFTGFVLLP